MATASLHGNGETCPHCELRREEANLELIGAARVPCNSCGGTGKIGYSVASLIASSVAWARENYWPDRISLWETALGPQTPRK